MRKQRFNDQTFAPRAHWLMLGLAVLGICLAQTGCRAPIGADLASPALTYRQTHDSPLSHSGLSRETQEALRRLGQAERFAKNPDATLQLLHQEALDSRSRSLLFTLSELHYQAGERLRHSVKPWEPRDARDYYLASAVYAWLYLLGDAAQAPPNPSDEAFRAACDLYNYGLGWALTGRRATNGVAILRDGIRRLPVGQMEITFSQAGFPWPLSDFDRFVLADQLLVRGLSVRNRQAGLGAPLVGVVKPTEKISFSRSVSATAFLRLNGGLSDLAQGRCRGSLELFSTCNATTVRIGERSVPLETDTTVKLAYALNQPFLWKLGNWQFLSAVEKVPTDVYLTQPYQTGRVPVVFVHGTFSSPVWWAEMVNTLSADPVLRERCQFWYFIYNSGIPTVLSAARLREALASKFTELDPQGNDPALRQMVLIGHSQGGLLTKLTAADTGDILLQAVLKTNRLEDLNLTAQQQAIVRQRLCYKALPFVKRVIFISTPHRGSYKISGLAQRLARKLVSLPQKLLEFSTEIAALQERLALPTKLRGVPTSLDSMSPRNPIMLTLADIPLAPEVKGHSIIPVKGKGDYHRGKDGVVAYQSAHVPYVESEFIVRGSHSCQDMPPTIEEVRRILHEHLSTLPASATNRASAN